MTKDGIAPSNAEVRALYGEMLLLLGGLDRLRLFQAGAYAAMSMEIVRSRFPELHLPFPPDLQNTSDHDHWGRITDSSRLVP